MREIILRAGESITIGDTTIRVEPFVSAPLDAFSITKAFGIVDPDVLALITPDTRTQVGATDI